jgi:hypothetical protein
MGGSSVNSTAAPPSTSSTPSGRRRARTPGAASGAASVSSNIAEEAQRRVSEILSRQQQNATDEFDIMYERMQVLVLPPGDSGKRGNVRASDQQQPKLGLSLSDTPDGRIFVAAVNAGRAPPKSRVRSLSRSSVASGRSTGSEAATSRPSSRASQHSGKHRAGPRSHSPAAPPPSSSGPSSLQELKALTRKLKSNGSASYTTSVGSVVSGAESELGESRSEVSWEDELLVFDENALPVVNEQGLDPKTLLPVVDDAPTTGLRPGDVIMMLDNVPLKSTDTLASVANRLLYRTMRRGTWVTVARPIGRIMRGRSAAAATTSRSSRGAGTAADDSEFTATSASLAGVPASEASGKQQQQQRRASTTSAGSAGSSDGAATHAVSELAAVSERQKDVPLADLQWNSAADDSMDAHTM